ncbi:MAG: 3-hydroxyacyl-ACP dehydratase FabZ [Oligoflexales bacterium]|nr:3-hydroxyacyl-ACP dehydratase FabZ [Oligoflexales bacterium]
MDGLELKLPLEVNDIKHCLPHRHPFLLIDRVHELVPSEMVVATKNISISDPILQGHFPDNPVYPGVLIVESMAQASAVLGHFSLKKGYSSVLLTEITGARFRKQVIPGDTLTLKITVERTRVPFFWFKSEAFVDGDLVAKAQISAAMK